MNALFVALSLLSSESARDVRALPAMELLAKVGADSSEAAAFLRTEAQLRAGQTTEAIQSAQTFQIQFPGSTLTSNVRLLEAWGLLQTGEAKKACIVLSAVIASTDRQAARVARDGLSEWVRSGNIPVSELLLLPSLLAPGEDTLVRAIAQAVTGRPLVAILPASGGFAQIGRRVFRGAQLAASESKTPVVLLDEPTDPIETALLVRGVLAVCKPRAIIGPLLSNTSAAAALEVARSGSNTPLILPAATSPGVSSLASTAWQLNITTGEQGKKAAQVAQECFKASEAYLLWPKSEFGESVGEGFRAEFSRLGGRIAWQRTYAAGATDFRAILESMRKSAQDLARRRGQDTSNLAPVVFVPGESPSEALALAAQAAQLGMKVRWIGASGWHSRQFLLETSGRMDGALLVSDNVPDETRLPWKDFSRKWRGSEGDAPDRLAALGWDAAQIALLPSVSPSFAGAQADLKFDPTGRNNVNVGVLRVEKGAFVSGCKDR